MCYNDTGVRVCQQAKCRKLSSDLVKVFMVTQPVEGAHEITSALNNKKQIYLMCNNLSTMYYTGN